MAWWICEQSYSYSNGRVICHFKVIPRLPATCPLMTAMRTARKNVWRPTDFTSINAMLAGDNVSQKSLCRKISLWQKLHNRGWGFGEICAASDGDLICWCFSINWLICLVCKTSEKKQHYDIQKTPEPNLVSSNCLICQTNSSNSKHTRSRIISNGDKLHIQTKNRHILNIYLWWMINRLSKWMLLSWNHVIKYHFCEILKTDLGWRGSQRTMLHF